MPLTHFDLDPNLLLAVIMWLTIECCMVNCCCC